MHRVSVGVGGSIAVSDKRPTFEVLRPPGGLEETTRGRRARFDCSMRNMREREVDLGKERREMGEGGVARLLWPNLDWIMTFLILQGQGISKYIYMSM